MVLKNNPFLKVTVERMETLHGNTSIHINQSSRHLQNVQSPVSTMS